MITLSPGPSQVSPETKDDIRRAINEGILELSHRSKKFSAISKKCIEGLRTYLRVPKEYKIFYFSSASDIWHSLVANTVHKHSFHFVNGAFSAKAREAAIDLHKDAQAAEFSWSTSCDIAHTKIPTYTELITACYNETSTGVTMLPAELEVLKDRRGDALLAIDLTSCAGAVPLAMHDADVWYFSVQKVFGLPAGLAIGIISPRAFKRSELMRKEKNSLAGSWAWTKLEETMKDDVYHTPHTPNVLNIFLLGEQCARWNIRGGIDRIIRETREKQDYVNAWLSKQNTFAHFVPDERHRSSTVLTISATPQNIELAHAVCAQNGIELGNGYGKIKKETFRIANFPAVSKEDLGAATLALSKI